MKSDGPLAEEGTTIYTRIGGGVEVRYAYFDEESGMQYGYLYDVEKGEQVGDPMPLPAFTKFDVFEVVDDPDIIAVLSEGEEAWETIEDRRANAVGKALMSVLVKDDKIQALWYEIIGVEGESHYRVNGEWRDNPEGADIEDAEENFIAPEHMKEVIEIFDTNPQDLLSSLENYEASDDYLRVVLPDMYTEAYEQ